MKQYNIECTEEQLLLISKCVEDCCRFASGQTELFNTSSLLTKYGEIRDSLQGIKHLVTPELSFNASYGWNGGGCPNNAQRKFIAKTYPIYREILHHLAIEGKWNNVYDSPTLTCEEGGELIKIKRVDNEDNQRKGDRSIPQYHSGKCE